MTSASPRAVQRDAESSRSDQAVPPPAPAWVQWAWIAVDHEAAARAASTRVETGGEERRPQAEIDESMAALVTVAAAASALEALGHDLRSQLPRRKRPPKRKRRGKGHRNARGVDRLARTIAAAGRGDVRTEVDELFRLRDDVVHRRARAQAVACAAEAERSVDLALQVIEAALGESQSAIAKWARARRHVVDDLRLRRAEVGHLVVRRATTGESRRARVRG